MRRAFQQKNMSKSRSEWLFSYDALTVPLDDHRARERGRGVDDIAATGTA